MPKPPRYPGARERRIVCTDEEHETFLGLRDEMRNGLTLYGHRVTKREHDHLARFYAGDGFCVPQENRHRVTEAWLKSWRELER